MSDDLENLHRWAAGEPLLGLPRSALPTVSADINTEMVAQPFYFNVSSRGATGAELFRNPENHADAAAAVMTYAGIKIATFPGFFLDRSEETVEQRTSQNIDYMINQIRSAYIGFGDADINGIIQSIQRMANSILNKSSRESDKAIFSQDAIQRSSYTTYITLFYATLSMKLDQHGKKTYVEQTYRIARTVIRLNTTFLITYANELASILGDGGLDEWGRQYSSPTGDKLSCFENHFNEAPKEA
ncbi:hypothetical protein BGX30_000645 [Mortierella sp. GBA39]|nr:hypothetical protein BGX30_000645 [Mortierella sp. GBA39]